MNFLLHDGREHTMQMTTPTMTISAAGIATPRISVSGRPLTTAVGSAHTQQTIALTVALDRQRIVTIDAAHILRSRVYLTVGRPSVCPSVCPIHRQKQLRPAGLLLSAVVCSGYRSITAGAVIQAPVLSSKRG